MINESSSTNTLSAEEVRGHVERGENTFLELLRKMLPYSSIIPGEDLTTYYNRTGSENLSNGGMYLSIINHLMLTYPRLDSDTVETLELLAIDIARERFDIKKLGKAEELMNNPKFLETLGYTMMAMRAEHALYSGATIGAENFHTSWGINSILISSGTRSNEGISILSPKSMEDRGLYPFPKPING